MEKRLAPLRDGAQAVQDEPGQGFKARPGRQVNLVLLFEVVQAGAPVQHQSAGGQPGGDGGGFIFVPHLAHNRLHDIGQGHQPLHAAELVHHHRQVHALAAKLLQQLRQQLGFGHEQGTAHKASQLEGRHRLPLLGPPHALSQVAKQVLGVHHPDDLLGRTLEDRVAAAAVVADGFEGLLQGGAGRQAHHFRPRHHHLAHLERAQFQPSLQHPHLLRRQHSVLAHLMQQQSQLLGRTQQGVPGRGPVAHHAQEEVAGAVEQADQRPKDAHEHLHRARDHQRHLLRPLQRHALGHQLAQHHVQRHNQQEGQGDGDGMRHRRRPGNPHTDQQRLEKSGDGDLPQPAQRQGSHGNAQLHTGEDPV